MPRSRVISSVSFSFIEAKYKGHIAVPLSDRRILSCGGVTADMEVVQMTSFFEFSHSKSCYLIDAADDEADWLEQVVDDMITSRSFFTMAAFFDSEGREKVLVASGVTSSLLPVQFARDMEVLDVQSLTWDKWPGYHFPKGGGGDDDSAAFWLLPPIDGVHLIGFTGSILNGATKRHDVFLYDLVNDTWTTLKEQAISCRRSCFVHPGGPPAGNPVLAMESHTLGIAERPNMIILRQPAGSFDAFYASNKSTVPLPAMSLKGLQLTKAVMSVFKGGLLLCAHEACRIWRKLFWSPIESPPVPRHSHFAVVALGPERESVWFIGGFERAGESGFSGAVDKVDFYTSNREMWDRGPDYPSNVHSHAAVAIADNAILSCGGSKHGLISKTRIWTDACYIMRQSRSSWRDTARMRRGRGDFQLTVTQDKKGRKIVLAVGGSNENGGSAENLSVEAYDVNDKTWTERPDAPFRSQHIFVTEEAGGGGNLIALVGRKLGKRFGIFRYDAGQESWTMWEENAVRCTKECIFVST